MALYKRSDGRLHNQIRDVKNGLVSYYQNDDAKSIYKQSLLYEIQDEIGSILYEVREDKTIIDNSQDFDIITQNVQ